MTGSKIIVLGGTGSLMTAARKVLMEMDYTPLEERVLAQVDTPPVPQLTVRKTYDARDYAPGPRRFTRSDKVCRIKGLRP